MTTPDRSDAPIWLPAPARVAAAQLSDFMKQAEKIAGSPIRDYAALHAWSIDSAPDFWKLVWDFAKIIGSQGNTPIQDAGKMPGARYFPAGRLNYAENLLRDSGNQEALVFWGEDKVKVRMTRRELRREVARFAAALTASGVDVGDRVAAYMPNMPETLIAMLATASLGAVFTSASPDFGVAGVLDRFGQTEPKVMIACDGYWYRGKPIDLRGNLSELTQRLPSLRRLVIVPYLRHGAELDIGSITGAVSYRDFTAPYTHVGTPEFRQMPFNHPLFIMYSSGTTGVPKCIVHGAGGVLLQHVKEHRLHSDVKEGDRLFYYTTCGWMMWNWLISGLASGATLILYDGNPFIDENRILWEYAEKERISHFGTSAKYIETLEKSGLLPAQHYPLPALRAILSTGSPLAPRSFDFVYEHIKEDIQLASISGGTDILCCFVLGNPLAPVWRGEIQCIGLGLAVEAWDQDGQAVVEEKGELVCTRPFPSMPIAFWNDQDGSKYRAAYFERFPGVWCHGDFCEVTGHGGVIIYGRSDATLNPGGVRIGTAEIYRQVERLPEVIESVVISQDWPPEAPTDVRLVLFVRLRDNTVLNKEMEDRIRQLIRANTTPRHVPAKILQVADIPRTKNGKLVELAVRNVVHGLAVKNVEALANPEALAHFSNRAELKS
ncbi:MAG: acetoacetate--CoA ligase [Desulfobulbaceae bacterium]|jgi:acetoacetyl-CoA synthetase|nr:acetoacetate--CoA ligase [Desulfobulbaceae bacterium]